MHICYFGIFLIIKCLLPEEVVLSSGHRWLREKPPAQDGPRRADSPLLAMTFLEAGWEHPPVPLRVCSVGPSLLLVLYYAPSVSVSLHFYMCISLLHRVGDIPIQSRKPWLFLSLSKLALGAEHQPWLELVSLGYNNHGLMQSVPPSGSCSLSWLSQTALSPLSKGPDKRQFLAPRTVPLTNISPEFPIL